MKNRFKGAPSPQNKKYYKKKRREARRVWVNLPFRSPFSKGVTDGKF